MRNSLVFPTSLRTAPILDRELACNGLSKTSLPKFTAKAQAFYSLAALISAYVFVTGDRDCFRQVLRIEENEAYHRKV